MFRSFFFAENSPDGVTFIVDVLEWSDF